MNLEMHVNVMIFALSLIIAAMIMRKYVVVKMEVVSVTPHMVTVPDQASALPNSIQRGRVILLRPMAGEPQDRIDQLLHGESVVIRVKPKSLLDLFRQI